MYDNPMYLDNETLTQYMARMSQVAQDATRRAQFGDNLTLQAAADLYNTNIELFNSANGEILQTIQPSNGGDNNNNGIGVMRLIFDFNKQHYTSTQPLRRMTRGNDQ
jgi:hypothetical protein